MVAQAPVAYEKPESFQRLSQQAPLCTSHNTHPCVQLPFLCKSTVPSLFVGGMIVNDQHPVVREKRLQGHRGKDKPSVTGQKKQRKVRRCMDCVRAKREGASDCPGKCNRTNCPIEEKRNAHVPPGLSSLCDAVDLVDAGS